VQATRREQAVQLRLAGLSRSQIAEALGLATGGGEPLTTWLRDVPAPAWTRRPRAKDDLRETALAMRQEGRSYREIREVVSVSKSTLSLWLRDVPLTEEQQRALTVRGPEATASRHAENRALAARRRAYVRAQAREQIAELSESELFVGGVVAYWAEGSKNKPWRHGQSVQFMNSDPAMIRLFLAWLRLVGVPPERLIFRVHIHESAAASEAITFWSHIVGAPESQFGKPTIKTHKPLTVRKNVGSDYHGCLLVYVRNSATLNLQIEGWFEGLSACAAGASRFETVSGVV
jgi:hypothetical protein